MTDFMNSVLRAAIAAERAMIDVTSIGLVRRLRLEGDGQYDRVTVELHRLKDLGLTVRTARTVDRQGLAVWRVTADGYAAAGEPVPFAMERV